MSLTKFVRKYMSTLEQCVIYDRNKKMSILLDPLKYQKV
jgi:hypothetical protein